MYRIILTDEKNNKCIMIEDEYYTEEEAMIRAYVYVHKVEHWRWKYDVIKCKAGFGRRRV